MKDENLNRQGRQGEDGAAQHAGIASVERELSELIGLAAAEESAWRKRIMALEERVELLDREVTQLKNKPALAENRAPRPGQDLRGPDRIFHDGTACAVGGTD